MNTTKNHPYFLEREYLLLSVIVCNFAAKK